MRGIEEQPKAVNWVLHQQPDAVFGYGHEGDRQYWAHWTDRYKIPWVPMPTAGDHTIYSVDNLVTKTHDIVYLGGRWAYKSQGN